MTQSRKLAKSSVPVNRQTTVGYWDESRRPWPSLLLLLPLLAIYELGVLAYAKDYDIVARADLRRLGEHFGVDPAIALGPANLYVLPGLIVVCLLLGWHLVRRDAWRIKPSLCCKMAIEGQVLALPLFILMGKLGEKMIPHQAVVGATAVDWRAELIFSVGAGIYEEILFRVIVIALVHAIAVSWLKLPDWWGAGISIVASALLFGLYHFPSAADFNLGRFMLYFVAGVYLAGVYLFRGLGIAAGTHAMYDIYVALARLALG